MATEISEMIGEYIIPTSIEKATTDCFKDAKRYQHRDDKLDCLLPKNQHAVSEGKIASYQLKKNVKSWEVVLDVLKVIETSDLDLIAKTLINNGCTVTLVQIEMLIERTDAGEKTELRIDGLGNFFFTENNNGGVSVVCVRKYGDRWYVYIYSLDRDCRCLVENLFFFRK